MVHGRKVAGDWFDVITLSNVRKVATEAFLEGIAGLSDILQTAFFAADDVYHVFCFAIKAALYLDFFFGFP